jgi:hypothetical protein
MKVEGLVLPDLHGTLLAGTLTSSGRFVGVTGSDYPPMGEGLRNTANDRLMIGSREISLPFGCTHPAVATPDERTVVIVDRREHQGLENAWVLREGEVVASFHVGDAVQQILATETTLT